MADVMKKGVGLVVVLFLLWFLFTDPNGFGDLARGLVTWIWELLQDMFAAVRQFLNSVSD